MYLKALDNSLKERKKEKSYSSKKDKINEGKNGSKKERKKSKN